MRIGIIGYPGAGKTTLANALAGQIGVPPHLEATGRLITIDASGSRAEVLANALDVLGIRI